MPPAFTFVRTFMGMLLPVDGCAMGRVQRVLRVGVLSTSQRFMRKPPAFTLVRTFIGIS